jgi:hypothetical protein
MPRSRQVSSRTLRIKLNLGPGLPPLVGAIRRRPCMEPLVPSSPLNVRRWLRHLIQTQGSDTAMSMLQMELNDITNSDLDSGSDSSEEGEV